MFKITDIHPSPSPNGEYLVLQNQGLNTLNLRGWAVCTDAWLKGDAQAAARETVILTDDVGIKPYTRVVLFTGMGENGWYPTTDGKPAYLVYCGRAECLWSCAENLHLLHPTGSRKVVFPAEQGLTAGMSL